MRRLITRLCALIPALFLVGFRGNDSITDLLTLSQVVLAIQLPLAMVPLLIFAGSSRRMGEGRIGPFLLAAGWSSCAVITLLDIYGLPGAIHDAVSVFRGH
jgi:manganese transport protein